MSTSRDHETGRRKWLVALVVGVGTLLSAMAGSTVTLALPELGRDLGISIDDAGWVMEAFLLAVTVLLLAAGRGGDLFGHGRVYVVGFLVFGLASLVCGLATGFVELIVARVAQGVGGALIMSTAPALLTTTFPPRERGKALGIVSTATYTGLTIGPPLGGFMIAALGWRWIFFLNVPTTVIMLVLGAVFLPRGGERRGVRIDLLGAAVVAAGLPLALMAVVEGNRWGWTSMPTVAAALAGVLLLTVFVLIEARVEAPLLRLALFRSKVFSGALVSAVSNYVGLFVPIILIPFYLREGRGLEPMTTGMLLMMQPLVMAVVASPAGWLSDKVGTRWLATGGMTLLSIGLVGLATIGAETSLVVVAFWLGLMGLGTGIFISPNSSALMGSAPRDQQGVAGGMLAVGRNVGMMLGVAMAMTVFSGAGGQTGSVWRPEEFHALRLALVLGAGAGGVGAAAAALRGKTPVA